MSQLRQHTISVDTSTASSSVSIDVSSKAASVTVGHRLEYLAQTEIIDVEFPAQDSLRFWFDFSDPNCFAGTSSSFNDLSGNNNHGNLVNIVDGIAGSAVSDIEPFIGYDEQGTFIRVPNGGGQTLYWEADSTAPDQVSAVLVAKNEFVPSPSLDEATGGLLTNNPLADALDVIEETSAAEFQTRSGGGLSFATHRTYSQTVFRENYAAEYYGLDYFLVSQSSFQRHTTFTATEIDTFAFTYYNKAEDSLLDGSNILKPYLGGFLYDCYDPSAPCFSGTYPGKFQESGVRRLQYTPKITPVSDSAVQIVSVSLDGTQMSNHLNGQEVSDQDIFAGRKDSESGKWYAGAGISSSGVLGATSGGKFYAIALFDKALTQEEHKQVFDYYNRGTIRPSFPAFVSLPPSVQIRADVSDTVVDISNAFTGIFTVLGGRQRAEISLDLPSSSASFDVSIDASSKAVSVDIPFSASNAVDLSIDPPFKNLWKFKSDFSTSTSNPFPIYFDEPYQGQKEELYDVSYNQTGPDGLDGWLKIELKRDFRVGYPTRQHPNGEGLCDGVEPFLLRTFPNDFDWDINGGTIDSSTDFKWTDAFDSFLAKGVNNQPPAVSYSMSFKLAYSQAAPSPVADTTGVSPTILFDTQNIVIDLPSGTDFSALSGLSFASTFDASPDSTSTPGLTDSFFNFSNTVRGGATYSWLDVSDIEEIDSNYFPVLSPYSYKELVDLLPFANAAFNYLALPWVFSMRPMKFSVIEAANDSGIVVPSGFYIMLKDISWQSDTVPSDTYYGDPPVQESRIDPADRL